MEENKIRELFEDFNPALSSDLQFLSKLENNLNTIELIRQQTLLSKKNMKIAVGVAAIVGFFMGILFMLLMPILDKWLTIWLINIPLMNMAPISLDTHIILWCAFAIVSGIISYNAYVLTITKMSMRVKVISQFSKSRHN